MVTLAEQTNKVYEEVPLYPIDQFLAEVGGTAGLFLGLSLLTVVKFIVNAAVNVATFYKFFLKFLRKYLKHVLMIAQHNHLKVGCQPN